MGLAGIFRNRIPRSGNHTNSDISHDAIWLKLDKVGFQKFAQHRT